ncbi:MAG TPA: hypothetical protein VFX43_09365 [Chitinophagaceae bacterium]|nr:hypothetical protein [Chitinophagaceae bacterium]
MTTVLNIDRLDAHERLQKLNQLNSLGITENLNMMIKADPFDGRRFYIFAHARKDEDGIRTRIIWQPRLIRPKSQTNSMLFKVDPKKPEEVNVIWIIPPREQWSLFEKGKMCENQTVTDSIHLFETDRARLEASDPDDPDDATAQKIYEQISQEARRRRAREESISKLNLDCSHMFKMI